MHGSSGRRRTLMPEDWRKYDSGDCEWYRPPWPTAEHAAGTNKPAGKHQSTHTDPKTTRTSIAHGCGTSARRRCASRRSGTGTSLCNTPTSSAPISRHLSNAPTPASGLLTPRSRSGQTPETAADAAAGQHSCPKKKTVRKAAGADNVVGKLQLGDARPAHRGHANPEAGDALLAQGRVEHARFAVPVGEAHRAPKNPAEEDLRRPGGKNRGEGGRSANRVRGGGCSLEAGAGARLRRTRPRRGP